ncbi:TPA: hypothetical protein N2A77_002984 [Pseudomonas aeruginosa]|nr:hypothetical protein [Pseudomonas aeruginosa]
MKADTSYSHRGPMQRQEVVLAFFKEKGQRTTGARVEYYQRIIERFSKTPELNDAEAWALAELHELYVVIHGAKKNQLIAEQLSKCLGGACSLENEQAKNSGNAPRNISFELFIASKMVLFGANILIPPFGRNADINFIFNGLKIPIECKRLYAPGKVSRLMQDACSQVSGRLDDGQYGIAAISLTREFWSNFSSTVMESIDEAREAVEQLYLSWRSETFRLLMAYPKVALIYIHIHLPCVGEEQVFHIYEREFFRTRINYENLPEAPIVNEFVKIMTSNGIANAIQDGNY